MAHQAASSSSVCEMPISRALRKCTSKHGWQRLPTTWLKRMSSFVFSSSAPAACTDRIRAPNAFWDSATELAAVSFLKTSAQQPSPCAGELFVGVFMESIFCDWMVEFDFAISVGERKTCPAAPSMILPMTKQFAPRCAKDCSSISSRSGAMAMSNPPEVCASNRAVPEIVHRAVERWQRIGENFRAEPAWSEHPPQMREEAKARDVRAGRRARFLHRVRRRPVQRGHGNFSRRHAGRIIAPNLAAKRQHTRAQRLGEDQRVAGVWFFQRGGHGGIDHARDGKTKFDFIILDAVSADERDAGLLENLHRAVEHLKNNFARQIFGGERQQAQRRARFAAHRVDLRKAIRRADFSEEPGIVHARREHVHRLHEAKVVCNPDRKSTRLNSSHANISYA